MFRPEPAPAALGECPSRSWLERYERGKMKKPYFLSILFSRTLSFSGLLGASFFFLGMTFLPLSSEGPFISKDFAWFLRTAKKPLISRNFSSHRPANQDPLEIALRSYRAVAISS